MTVNVRFVVVCEAFAIAPRCGASSSVKRQRWGAEVELSEAAGLNLDDGMVFCYQGQLYHGDACMNVIALLSDTGSVLSYLMVWVFRSSGRSKLLYPWLRAGRNLTLLVIAKEKDWKTVLIVAHLLFIPHQSFCITAQLI